MTFNSAAYWENRYATGKNSGAGSYGKLAKFKAEFLNKFYIQHNIQVHIDFGCGDGNQLGLLKPPRYVGVDVSSTVLEKIRSMFPHKQNYQFVHVDDEEHLEVGDLTTSIDVIYHLIEDDVFEAYMRRLFKHSSKFVIIYASNIENITASSHVRHRKFTEFVFSHFPEWELVETVENKYPWDAGQSRQTSFADFFVFARKMQVGQSWIGVTYERLEAPAELTPPCIVSMTTIRSRLGGVAVVLNSLLEQSLPPDQILLTVSEEPYGLDEGVRRSDIPEAVLELEAQGRVEILYVPNTGPYRKLIPALERFRGTDQLIATADDDTIYPRHWLRGLVEGYQTHRCVIAYRCRLMSLADGRFTSYSSWKVRIFKPEDPPPGVQPMMMLPTGVRGVLYHASFFPDFELLYELRRNAPFQDDLAFKAATMFAGVRAASVSDPAALEAVGHFGKIASDQALYRLNKQENDNAWERLVDVVKSFRGVDLATLADA